MLSQLKFWLGYMHVCFSVLYCRYFPKGTFSGATSQLIFGDKIKWLRSAHTQGRRHLDLEYQLPLYNPSLLKPSQMQPQPQSTGLHRSQEQLLSTLPQQNLYSQLFFFWKSITCPAECSKRGLQVTFSTIILFNTEELFKSYTLSRSQEGKAARWAFSISEPEF